MKLNNLPESKTRLNYSRVFDYNINGGDNMDSLILTFNPKQLNLYKELLHKEDIDLTFNTDILPIEKYSFDILNTQIVNIEMELTELLKFSKQETIFSTSLTQDKTKELIPVYYKAISNIDLHLKDLIMETQNLSIKIEEAHKISLDISQRYSNFLPYKAALFHNPEYTSKIQKTDEEFKESIEKSKEYNQKLLSYFNSIIDLSDIISAFFEKTAQASDEPKFANFNTKKFFDAVYSLIEQMKAIK